jgi:hypothetical protein
MKKRQILIWTPKMKKRRMTARERLRILLLQRQGKSFATPWSTSRDTESRRLWTT